VAQDGQTLITTADEAAAFALDAPLTRLHVHEGSLVA
jgi:hypothetical protein